jgi:RNA polymerase sigma-70 factor (ECF subfamily)
VSDEALGIDLALIRRSAAGDRDSFDAFAPESIALARERADLIEAALAALDADDREVLVLRDLEELSGEEAARILDVGLPALKSRLYRARLRFAARLREVAR